MLNFPAWKVAIIMGVLLLGGLLALPNVLSDGFMGVEPRDSGSSDPQEIARIEAQQEAADKSWWPSFLPSKKVNLGLDLQGGVYLLTEINPDEVAANRLESVLTDIN